MYDFDITKQFLHFALLGAGWVMYLLVACSILSISIIAERVLYFYRFHGDVGAFVRILTDKLAANEPPDRIAAWCSGQSLLEAKVAAAGLERAGTGIRAVEESMNATLIAARIKLDRGLTVLGTLGSNTPFIGLFGTVIGIIRAFHALSTNKSAGPETVMAEISEALVATALGLMVAVPAVIAYNVILRMIKKKMATSETVSRIILTHFGALSTHQPDSEILK